MILTGAILYHFFYQVAYLTTESAALAGFNGLSLNNWREKTMLKVAGSAARFLAGAALAASLSGCATGKIWSFDEKAEVDKSSEQHAAIVKRSGDPASTDLQDYVAMVGRKVAAASDCPKVAWTFSLLDSPKAQASSMPGGFVYINRGLMEMLRSENELAAVLAHEVAHICTHDATRREAIGQVAAYGNLGLLWSINPWALTSIFLVPEVALLPGIGTTAALNRRDEFNADRHGTEYLRRAGYPAEGMSAALEVLAGLEAYDRDHRKKGERVFGRPVIPMGRVYDDHPTAAKRRSKLGRAEAPAPDPVFLARLDGLAFGSTNRDGIASDSKRYFTQLDATIDFPKASVARASGEKVWVYGAGQGYMSVERIDPDAIGGPCEVLARVAYGTPLADIKESDDGGVRSCTAHLDQSKLVQARRGVMSRIGIVVAKPDSERYLFRIFEAYGAEKEQALLSIARSVKSPGPARPRTPVVRVRETQEGDTFASLAKTARIPDAEAQLRLINQRYPSGELKPGQLVKVIE